MVLAVVARAAAVPFGGAAARAVVAAAVATGEPAARRRRRRRRFEQLHRLRVGSLRLGLGLGKQTGFRRSGGTRLGLLREDAGLRVGGVRTIFERGERPGVCAGALLPCHAGEGQGREEEEAGEGHHFFVEVEVGGGGGGWRRRLEEEAGGGGWMRRRRLELFAL